ncbi:MAG: DUF4437 domain-containing protein [Rhodospirillaceae bacterium]|nr:DUF4437 domain-containing protein [Rhodospirillaceae bacterium]
MTRPHTEFIQSQVLPWNTWSDSSWHGGTEIKILSQDAATGAISALVRYPAGWTAAGPGHLDADEEFLVLNGALQINDETYGNFCYGHLPKGFPRAQAKCAAETIVLTFLSHRPSFGTDLEATWDAARHVKKIDVLSTPVSTDFERLGVRNTSSTSIRPNTASFLLLKDDPVTREQTWVLAARALRHGAKQEIHPVVEELYLLGGELIGPQGIMVAGAYFWRPPNMPHGPFGAKAGSLLFHRTIGGPLSTTYAEGPGAFDWHPAYNPILPPTLEAYRTRSLPQALPY